MKIQITHGTVVTDAVLRDDHPISKLLTFGESDIIRVDSVTLRLSLLGDVTYTRLS